MCTPPHTSINTVTTVYTSSHTHIHTITRVYTASPADTQIYCVGMKATTDMYTPPHVWLHHHTGTRCTRVQHQIADTLPHMPAWSEVASRLGARPAHRCPAPQVALPSIRGSHKPTRDAGPQRTHTRRSHTCVRGLFCSRCPGEHGPRPPGVTHCPLLSPPGRGRLPGRPGCQQGRPVGQVSAGSTIRFPAADSLGGSEKEGPPPGSAHDVWA